MEKLKAISLLRYLELSGFYQFAGFVIKLININAPCKIAKVDCGLIGNISLLSHFPSQHSIINLKRIAFVKRFLEIKIDDGCGRVGIKAENRGLGAYAA